MAAKVIVLTEGRADDAFLKYLLAHREIEGLEIRECHDKTESQQKETYGYRHFANRLRNLRVGTELDVRQYKSILIVADNDEKPADRFTEIANQIRDAEEYTIPTKPREPSPSGKLPPISVLLLPWDNIPGCLETLLLESAIDHVPDFAECVETFLGCVKATTKDGWKQNNISKLRLRSLLGASCKDNPGIGINLAWSDDNTKHAKDKKLIPLGHACFNRIAEYLRSLAAT